MKDIDSERYVSAIAVNVLRHTTFHLFGFEAIREPPMLKNVRAPPMLFLSHNKTNTNKTIKNNNNENKVIPDHFNNNNSNIDFYKKRNQRSLHC